MNKRRRFKAKARRHTTRTQRDGWNHFKGRLRGCQTYTEVDIAELLVMHARHRGAM